MTTPEALEALQGMSEVSSVRLLKMEPGDVLVIECPYIVSQEAAGRMAALVKQSFPENKVFVLDGGATLKVARA